jgi:general stress protein 26
MLQYIKEVSLRVFLDNYKARKQRNRLLTKEHTLSTARAMLNKATYCFLITHSTKPWCSARLVQPIIDAENFIIWFGTNPSSRKVQEIQANPHITVAIENTKEDANIVLYGFAEIEHDRQVRQKRWIESWQLFFPKGPLGEDYVVIRFEAQQMELMNFKRNVIPEPFGLKPLVLSKQGAGWELEVASAAT